MASANPYTLGLAVAASARSSSASASRPSTTRAGAVGDYDDIEDLMQFEPDDVTHDCAEVDEPYLEHPGDFYQRLRVCACAVPS